MYQPQGASPQPKHQQLVLHNWSRESPIEEVTFQLTQSSESLNQGSKPCSQLKCSTCNLFAQEP